MKKLFLLPVILTGAFACSSSTKLVNSWVEPSTQQIDFNNVLVVALVGDPNTRRITEDTIISELVPRSQAVASYTMLADQKPTKEQIVEMAQKADARTLITMRLASTSRELQYVPGNTLPSPYYSFDRYYSWAEPTMYDPGYLKDETTVQVETNIYSVADQKLIYSARSQTLDPKSVDKAVKAIADEVEHDLKKKGVFNAGNGREVSG